MFFFRIFFEFLSLSLPLKTTPPQETMCNVGYIENLRPKPRPPEKRSFENKRHIDKMPLKARTCQELEGKSEIKKDARPKSRRGKKCLLLKDNLLGR